MQTKINDFWWIFPSGSHSNPISFEVQWCIEKPCILICLTFESIKLEYTGFDIGRNICGRVICVSIGHAPSVIHAVEIWFFCCIKQCAWLTCGIQKAIAKTRYTPSEPVQIGTRVTFVTQLTSVTRLWAKLQHSRSINQHSNSIKYIQIIHYLASACRTSNRWTRYNTIWITIQLANYSCLGKNRFFFRSLKNAIKREILLIQSCDVPRVASPRKPGRQYWQFVPCVLCWQLMHSRSSLHTCEWLWQLHAWTKQNSFCSGSSCSVLKALYLA